MTSSIDHIDHIDQKCVMKETRLLLLRSDMKKRSTMAIQLIGIMIALVFVPASCQRVLRDRPTCQVKQPTNCTAQGGQPPSNDNNYCQITVSVPAVIAVNIRPNYPARKATNVTVWLTTSTCVFQCTCYGDQCTNINVIITDPGLSPAHLYIEIPSNALCKNVTVFDSSFTQLTPSVPPPYDNKEGLAVGLSVGLILLIAIIVVLAIFLVCRRRRQLAEWQSVNVSNASREGLPNEYEDVHSSRSTTDQGYQDLVPTSRSTPDQGYQDLVPTSRSTPGQGYQDLVPTSDPLYHTIQAPDKQITNKIRSGNFIPGNPSIPNAPPAAAAASYDDGELTVVDNPFYVSQGQVGANYELAGPMYDNPSFRNNVQPATKLKAADNRNVGDQTLHPGNNDKAGYQGYGLTVIDNSVYGNHEEHSGPTSVPSDATSLQRNSLSGDDDLGHVVIDNTIYKV